MKVHIFLICLAGLFSATSSQCHVDTYTVGEESRLAVIRNGELANQVLGRNVIPIGTVLDFICHEDNIVTVTCLSNGSFDATLPIRNCFNPPRAEVEQISDSTCKAETFRVGYRIGSRFYELYRSCYRRDQVRALFTKHILQPHNIYPSRPRVEFTTDGIISRSDSESCIRRLVYDKFIELLGWNQNYVNPDTLYISRGHLTPSADFIYPINMGDTFKYINIAPTFTIIDGGNWQEIEKWVRNYVFETGPAEITTGAFNILELLNDRGNPVPMFLLDNTRTPIPMWLYKVVKNTRATIVFVTLNNIFNNERPNAPCTTESCPRPLNLDNSLNRGYTFCCEPNAFINNLPWLH